jgi:hypothetical protein
LKDVTEKENVPTEGEVKQKDVKKKQVRKRK